MIPYTEEAHGVFATRLYERGECREIHERLVALDGWAEARVRGKSGGGAYASFKKPVVRSAGILDSEQAADVYGGFHARMDAVIKPLVRQVWRANLRRHSRAQILRYTPGGHYAPHQDCGLDLNERYFTVVCYLNDDFEGGSTSFPSLGHTVAPRAGKAVFFPSQYVHCSEPVVSGVKFVIVSWVLGPAPVEWLPRARR